MAIDFNEAREIIEAAKKRGLIRAQGEAAPEGKKMETSGAVLPDWLKESVQNPAAPEGFRGPEEREEPREGSRSRAS
jgi:hypothetical protein